MDRNRRSRADGRKARPKCEGLPNVTFVEDDVVTFDFEKADLIVSYYCVQFIPPRLRQELFNRIYDRLNWGGAFLLFEKVRAPTRASRTC